MQLLHSGEQQNDHKALPPKDEPAPSALGYRFF